MGMGPTEEKETLNEYKMRLTKELVGKMRRSLKFNKQMLGYIVHDIRSPANQVIHALKFVTENILSIKKAFK